MVKMMASGLFRVCKAVTNCIKNINVTNNGSFHETFFKYIFHKMLFVIIRFAYIYIYNIT